MPDEVPLSRGITALYIKECEAKGCRVNQTVMKLFAAADLAPPAEQLTEVDLSSTYLGDKGAQAVCSVLETCRALRRVSFEGCRLEEPAVASLCEAFKRHPSIGAICLRSNRLFASSGRRLCELLKANARLHTLDCDTSEMPPRVEAALRALLARNTAACFPAPPPPPPADPHAGLERLDELLLSLQQPSADALADAVRDRIVHFWNCRLGPFAMQMLLDYGISEASAGRLAAVERRYCDLAAAPSPKVPAPLLHPLACLESEIETICAALASPEPGSSLLAAIAEARGRTVRLQAETIADEWQRAAAAASGDLGSSAGNAALRRLVTVLGAFRAAVAGVSLRDVATFYTAGAGAALLPADSPVRAALLGAVAAEEDSQLAAFATLINTVYARRRVLLLLCDECRYFAVNHGAFAEAALRRAGTMRVADLDSGEVTPATSAADFAAPEADLVRKRSELLFRLEAALGSVDPEMVEFLRYASHAAAHSRLIDGLFQAEDDGQCAGDGDENASLPLVPFALHPFADMSAPHAAPSEALPSWVDAPKEAAGVAPRSSATDGTGGALEAATVALRMREHEDPNGDAADGSTTPPRRSLPPPPPPLMAAQDPIAVFGRIHDHAGLYRWCKAFGAWRRYRLIMTLCAPEAESTSDPTV